MKSTNTSPLEGIGEARPNMTPMIDVVFLLLVFFLVTMKFKTLDMKIEAQLPKTDGLSREIQRPRERVRLVARLDRPVDSRARLRLNGAEMGWTDDPAAWERLSRRTEEATARLVALGGDPADVEAEIDAAPRVHTAQVIRTIDAFRAADLAKVRFTGTPLAHR